MILIAIYTYINKCYQIIVNFQFMLSNTSTNVIVQNNTVKHSHDILEFEGEENDSTSQSMLYYGTFTLHRLKWSGSL